MNKDKEKKKKNYFIAKSFVSRVKRCRFNRNDFETIKIIGRGAFGEGK
jgi:hypothetical protein